MYRAQRRIKKFTTHELEDREEVEVRKVEGVTEGERSSKEGSRRRRRRKIF